MLILGSELIDTPVMSLQTGSELARTKQPIIDPWTLKIIAYELDGPLLNYNPALLRLADVRELSDVGMIVDSSDEFIGIDDVIKVRKTYDLHFSLIGIAVVDELKHKLGKVENYSVELGGFIIEQLTVRRPLIKSFNDAELLIHRSQIVEINDTAITVRSTARKIEAVKSSSVKNYTNPFRSGATQPEIIDTKS